VTTPYHNKALPAGYVLREWRLEQILGAGGFGIVYRGTGVYFGETVAIKEYFPSAISDRRDGVTVAPNDSSSEEIYTLGLKKFLEEAKVLWNLSRPERHPNIVSVRALFEIHGTAYMVMDFESGVSLSQMLKDGRTFDEASLMALIRPIALGLDRSHKAGVLHRDIKPANILVDDNGRPVLIDFGSARFDSGDATSTKVTFYTPPYAALEQYVRTYPQGPWTDIYALGIVLYQCVTGQKPGEVLERLHGEPGEPLSAREWPGYGRTFTRAVDAAMGLRPVERPQSIDAWLAMFDAREPEFNPEATQVASASTLAELTKAASFEPEPPPPPAASPAPPPQAAPEPATKAEPVAEFVREPTLAGPLPDLAVFGDPAPEPAAPATPSEPKPPARNKGLVVAAIIAVVALLGGAAALLLRPGGDGDAPANVATAPGVAPAAGEATGPAVGPPPPVLAQVGGLLEDARKLGRPRSELAGLIAAQGRLTTLDRQLAGLGSGPDAAAQAATLKAEMNTIAADAARAQRTAIAKAGDRRWRELDADLQWMSGQRASGGLPPAGGDEQAAVTAAHNAKRVFEDAIAKAANPADGASGLQLVSVVQAAYGRAMTAYDAANDFYLPVRKQALATEISGVRQIAGQVTSLSMGKKPGLLSSKARKDAYALMQENATKAQGGLTRLDEVAAGIGSSADRDQLDAAATKLAEIKADLTKVLASSREASAAAQ
jgi:serine/threonine protein kinase